MRTALVRRTVLTASAVSLALLATACGGSDKADAKKDDVKPSAAPSPSAPSAPAVKALTEAELEKAVLADGDVPKHKIRNPEAGDVSAAADVTSDKPECQPLALVGGLAPIGTVSAGVARLGASEPTIAGDPTSSGIMALRLASYEGKGAADAFASLKKAGADCAGGFVVTEEGEKTTIKSVTPATATGGDEVAAWTLVIEEDGETMQSPIVAVRRGATLVTVQSVSFTGKTAVPQDIVDAQLKKLG
ncbi:hypothetical protein [Streptomyces sp. NPDC051183]|uniref:hypothetical protein n=1 Tax=Streptomyces sp. NPDC051183 TaxID=3155165 RepID=UPI003440357B